MPQQRILLADAREVVDHCSPILASQCLVSPTYVNSNQVEDAENVLESLYKEANALTRGCFTPISKGNLVW